MRRRILIGLGLLLMVGSGFVVCLWMTQDPINERTFSLIKERMTIKHVEELIGEKTTPYWLPKKRGMATLAKAWNYVGEMSWKHWESGGAWIVVAFDGDGKVKAKYFGKYDRTDSITDKLRRWLHLPWW